MIRKVSKETTNIPKRIKAQAPFPIWWDKPTFALHGPFFREERPQSKEQGARRERVPVEIGEQRGFCSCKSWRMAPGHSECRSLNSWSFTKGPAILHSYDMPRFSFAFPSTLGGLPQGIETVASPFAQLNYCNFLIVSSSLLCCLITVIILNTFIYLFIFKEYH